MQPLRLASSRSLRRQAGFAWRGALVAVAILAGSLLVAKHFLLDSAAVPLSSGYVLDLGRVRSLATSSGGPLPERVNALVVATAEVPRGAIVAGSGFEAQAMIRSVFQVVYPDAKSIVIDSAYDRSQHEARAAGLPFDDAHFETLQQAMRNAEAIVVTHEHTDHIGGLAKSPHLRELLDKTLLTTEQLADPDRLADAGFEPDALAGYEALKYRGMHVVAPGVVLIKAPGHTPGSQMVYVKQASGTELLFIGDIAWNMDNVDLLIGRPLLVSAFLLREDRAAVFAQLRTLHELLRRERELHAVVAHDGQQLAQHVDAGRIRMGFE